jgi:hypothetical protein
VKVYQICLKNYPELDFCIWIASDDTIENLSKERDSNFEIKEIPEYDENTGGVDFIVRKEKLWDMLL